MVPGDSMPIRAWYLFNGLLYLETIDPFEQGTPPSSFATHPENYVAGSD